MKGRKIFAACLSVLLFTMSGCGTYGGEAASSGKEKTVDSSLSAGVGSSENGPLESFLNLSMVTVDSGYAVTNDSHLVMTSDRWKDWRAVHTVGDGPKDEDGGALFALDEKTVFLAFRTSTGIGFDRSTDVGANWSKSPIKMNVEDANSGYGGCLSLDFVDKTNGFLLSSSASGVGQ